MGHDERDPDVSRRDLGALLGILGGAVGLASLVGCADTSGALPEQTSTLREALTSNPTVLSVATVLGASPTHARTGDLALNGGPGSTVGTPINASVVIVGGVVTAGDGGGGIFYWSVSGTDDGGTVIVPNRNGGVIGATGPCWKRIYSGPINVKWFGATGSGGGLPPGNGTDDTLAIQAALNVFSTNGSGAPTLNPSPNAIYFPPGTYNISQRLNFHGWLGYPLRLIGAIVGDGIDGVRLLWVGAAGGTIARFGGLSESYIEHIGFDGNSSALIGLLIDSDQPTGGAGTANVTVRHCMFQGCVGPGSALVQLASAYQPNVSLEVTAIYFERCSIEGVGSGTSGTFTQYGIYVPNGYNVSGFCFTDCNFLNFQYGFNMTLPTAQPTAFTRCVFGNISQVFVQTGQHPVSFYQCSTQNAAGGMWCNGDASVSIRDCHIINNIAAANTTRNPNANGYVMFSTTQSLLIENCYIDGTGALGGTNPTAVRLGGTNIGTPNNTFGGFTSINNTWFYNSSLRVYNNNNGLLLGGEPNDTEVASDNGFAVQSMGDRGGNPSSPSVSLFPSVIGAVPIMFGKGPPTFGTWNQGAMMFNRLPSPGGSVGWICTAGGTGGPQGTSVWKTFGTIATT